jgi:hypothetical protein
MVKVGALELGIGALRAVSADELTQLYAHGMTRMTPFVIGLLWLKVEWVEEPVRRTTVIRG